MFYRNTGVSQVEKLINQAAPMGDSVAAGVRTRQDRHTQLVGQSHMFVVIPQDSPQPITGS